MRAMLFDFGGTLDHPRHWFERFHRHYEAAGLKIERDHLYSAYSHATKTAYHPDHNTHGHRLHDLVHFLVRLQVDHLDRNAPAHVREQLRSRPGGHHRIAEQIVGAFVEESRHGLAKSRGLLQALSRDFRLGVVSNFYGNLQVVLAEAGLRELLQVAIDSKRLGFFKPDTRIFEAALSALELPHRAVAVVGDSLENDCAPGKRLGLTTIWLDTGEPSGSPGRQPRDGAKRAPESVALADFTIGSLDELKDLKW